MSEQPKEAPKYELKTWIVSDSVSGGVLRDFMVAGWRPDPVLMPTGRPNIVDLIGAIYHLIKLPEEQEARRLALFEYHASQPTREWDHIIGVEALIHKKEMALKEITINDEHPLPVPASEEVILSTQYVENDAEKQKVWTDKGYFVAHKDHIGAKGTTFSLMGPRPKPKEPETSTCHLEEEPKPSDGEAKLQSPSPA